LLRESGFIDQIDRFVRIPAANRTFEYINIPSDILGSGAVHVRRGDQVRTTGFYTDGLYSDIFQKTENFKRLVYFDHFNDELSG
jgi:hypothetical protein